MIECATEVATDVVARERQEVYENLIPLVRSKIPGCIETFVPVSLKDGVVSDFFLINGQTISANWRWFLEGSARDLKCHTFKLLLGFMCEEFDTLGCTTECFCDYLQVLRDVTIDTVTARVRDKQHTDQCVGKMGMIVQSINRAVGSLPATTPAVVFDPPPAIASPLATSFATG